MGLSDSVPAAPDSGESSQVRVETKLGLVAYILGFTHFHEFSWVEFFVYVETVRFSLGVDCIIGKVLYILRLSFCSGVGIMRFWRLMV